MEKHEKQSTPTILLVDDEEGIRRLLEVILRPTGFHLLTAADGMEAMKVAQAYQGEINLLFSDVRMPCMDGVELAGRLSRQRPGMGVILCSGHMGAARPPDPGWRVIQKPFCPRDVLAQVRAALAA